MGERLQTSEHDNSKRIGVWIENGTVYRRDSEKHVFPQVYSPPSEDNLDEVLSLARSLHQSATMGNWTAQVEAQHNELTDRLRALLKPTAK